MIICDKCGYENRDRDLLCKNPACFEPLKKELDPPAPDPLPVPDVIPSLEPAPSPDPVPLHLPDTLSDPSPAPAASPGRYKLLVEQGLAAGKGYVLWDEEITIGRADEEENWFPVIDLCDQEQPGKFYVSRRHASLYLRDGKIRLKDMNSARGTRVNSSVLPKGGEIDVKEGDRIVLGGSVVLRLLSDEII